MEDRLEVTDSGDLHKHVARMPDLRKALRA
jgi:hypothetical protein